MENYKIPSNLSIGEHTLTIEAEADGLKTSTTIPFTINEKLEKPVCQIVLDTTQFFAYNTVHIDASSSYQENGSIVSYLWSTGETTPSIDLKLGETDTEITLTVTGEDSQTSSLTYPIVLKENELELEEYEVLKQSTLYSSYFIDKFGKYIIDDESIKFKDNEIVVPYGKQFEFNFRDTERFRNGVDELSFTLVIPGNYSSVNSYSNNLFEITFKNGLKIYSSINNGSSVKRIGSYIQVGSESKWVTFYNGSTMTKKVILKRKYNIKQKGKQIIVECEGYGTFTYDISNYPDIGGIESILLKCKPSTDTGKYFTTTDNVKLSNLVLKEIPQTEPTVTVTTNYNEEIDFGTICTLTANANQFEKSYLWSTGETTRTIQVTPKKTQEYSCIVTNNSSMEGVGYVTQQVKPYFPVPIISANGLEENVLVVGNTDLVIVRSKSYSPVGMNLTYKWYLNDELISTDKVVKLMGKSGTLRLEVEDEAENVETTSITIELTDKPSKKNVDLKRLTTYDVALKKFVKTDVIPEALLTDIENLFK